MNMVSLSSIVLCFALFCPKSFVQAGDYDASCQKSEEWIKHQSDWSSATWADLSECQRQTLGFDSKNKILLGAEGGASTIGISLGGDDGGCQGGTDCMRYCQALCCISKDCDIAMMHKKTDKNCEVSCDIYKEEVDNYLCYMYKSGSKRSGSSVTSSCYTDPSAPKLDNCRAIAADKDGFNWDTATFDYMKSLQTYTTCPSSTGKKLLAQPPIKVKKYPNVAKTVQGGLEKATCGFKNKIQSAAKKAGGAKKLLTQIKGRVKDAKPV